MHTHIHTHTHRRTHTYTYTHKGSCIVVKCDLSKEERQLESFVLKEYHRLISEGVDKACIKIKGYKLFLRKELHGGAHSDGFSISSCSGSHSSSPSTPRANLSLTPSLKMLLEPVKTSQVVSLYLQLLHLLYTPKSQSKRAVRTDHLSQSRCLSI